MALTAYSLDGAAASPYLTPIAISAEGVHTLAYGSLDVAGNAESTRTATVRIDYTAPVTSTNATTAAYAATATITLTPADAGSGVALTKWRVDGGAWTSSTSAVVPGSGGLHTLEYYSTDAAGNTEATKSVTVAMKERFDSADSRLVWKGTWSTYPHANHYLGSYRYANAAGATAYATFTGTEFTLVTYKAPECGIAAVSVDGGAPVDVDLYSAGYYYQQKAYTVSGLAAGRAHRHGELDGPQERERHQHQGRARRDRRDGAVPR